MDGSPTARGGFFGGTPRLAEGDRAQLLAGLGELDARLAARDSAPGRPWRARAAAALAVEPGVEDRAARWRWLDLAADLVEASAPLAGRGLVLEALAMEGVAGRLLGVLLGDGPEERALVERR